LSANFQWEDLMLGYLLMVDLEQGYRLERRGAGM
jgi:hypothetical protein